MTKSTLMEGLCWFFVGIFMIYIIARIAIENR
jgi:hypothetical protein